MKMIRISAALCCSLFALEVSAALKLDTSQPSFLIDKIKPMDQSPLFS